MQVIVGMDTWQQAALAAEIGNQAQVPVLSLAASASVRRRGSLEGPPWYKWAPMFLNK